MRVCECVRVCASVSVCVWAGSVSNSQVGEQSSTKKKEEMLLSVGLSESSLLV